MCYEERNRKFLRIPLPKQVTNDRDYSSRQRLAWRWSSLASAVSGTSGHQSVVAAGARTPLQSTGVGEKCGDSAWTPCSQQVLVKSVVTVREHRAVNRCWWKVWWQCVNTVQSTGVGEKCGDSAWTPCSQQVLAKSVVTAREHRAVNRCWWKVWWQRVNTVQSTGVGEKCGDS